MSRVKFTLGMGVPSSVGSSSWRDQRPVLVRTLPKKAVNALFADEAGDRGTRRSFHHFWPDGWSATVEAEILPPHDRTSSSRSFGGYDWMVDNIVRYGATEKPEPPRPPHSMNPETARKVK